jgi:flavin reductase (DIM6/NTAB) family NADH-FMN oxidoreductase RutF
MLASWVMQAAFDPPMLTLAIQRERGLRDLLEDSGFFTVSILGQDDGGLMKPFFSAPGQDDDRFESLQIEAIESAGGAPVLTDCHAWLACKVVGQMEAGDNLIYLGEILEGKRLKECDPKVHVRKSGFKY